MTPEPTSDVGELRIRQYRDFWDVPRMFVVEFRGRTLLFDCPFDDAREDYAAEYTVYDMPDLPDAVLAQPWAELPGRARRRLGALVVSDVEFGTDPRTTVTQATIERLLIRQAGPVGSGGTGDLNAIVGGATE